MLLRDREVHDFFFNNEQFPLMLNQVGKDDIKSFKNNNTWLAVHPSEAILFSNFAETWEKIKTPYRTTFRDLVTGPLPDESGLTQTMEMVVSRLKSLEWSITADMC